MKHLLIAITLTGCGAGTSEPRPPVTPGSDAAGTIRQIAGSYQTWGKVDEASRLAPAMCAAPAPRPVAQLRTSAAEDGPHATKVYYLYASDRDAYLRAAAPVGFRIVKEAFAAPAGAPAGLFVMAKVGTPDSDAGWIYGTTAPDGSVTSAGRVTACIGCHEHAPRDRLFGLRSVE
jgi:NADPH:quinone reductase-like Zn-dependent oxidoreductase